MIKLDFNKLAVCIKVKRGKRGLRDAAEEISSLSASTLSRVEDQRVDDISMSTFLALVNWLEMEPSEFLYQESDIEHFKPDYSLADEIKLLLGSSSLEPKLARVLIAMMDAGLKTIEKS